MRTFPQAPHGRTPDTLLLLGQMGLLTDVVVSQRWVLDDLPLVSMLWGWSWNTLFRVFPQVIPITWGLLEDKNLCPGSWPIGQGCQSSNGGKWPWGSADILRSNWLGQEFLSFLCKKHRVNTFSFEGQIVFVSKTQLCCCVMKSSTNDV